MVVEKNARPNGIEQRLSKYEPEDVIKEYYKALDRKDVETVRACWFKKSSSEWLTANMSDAELFDDTPSGGIDGGIKNVKSAKCMDVVAGEKNLEEGYWTFRVDIDMQYVEIITESNGETFFDCRMVLESPKTGWKISSFGR